MAKLQILGYLQQQQQSALNTATAQSPYYSQLLSGCGFPVFRESDSRRPLLCVIQQVNTKRARSRFKETYCRSSTIEHKGGALLTRAISQNQFSL
jgi:hypothetical protein